MPQNLWPGAGEPPLGLPTETGQTFPLTLDRRSREQANTDRCTQEHSPHTLPALPAPSPPWIRAEMLPAGGGPRGATKGSDTEKGLITHTTSPSLTPKGKR